MKYLSNIIKEFEKLPHKGYVCRSPKNEPTDSYFYLERYLAKFMMRSDCFNFHVDLVNTEMTGVQPIMI